MKKVNLSKLDALSNSALVGTDEVFLCVIFLQPLSLKTFKNFA
jgi:hypothetical protein